MHADIIRIVLRYLAGALVSLGVLAPSGGEALSGEAFVTALDAAITVGGVILGVLTEVRYARVRPAALR